VDGEGEGVVHDDADSAFTADVVDIPRMQSQLEAHIS
jgi:hypothetical protein